MRSLVALACLSFVSSLAQAGGAAVPTYPPNKNFIIEYIGVDHYDFLNGSADIWHSHHVNALLIPHPNADIASGPLDEKKFTDIWESIAKRTPGMDVWMGVGIHRSTYDPTTGKEIHQNFYPWESDAEWAVFYDNLRLAARAAKRLGFKGILFDSEWPWVGTAASPLLVWRQGPKKLVEKRAKEIVNLFATEYPGLLIGHYTMHYFEQGFPNYRPFWQAFFQAAKAAKLPALSMVEDTYWARDTTDWSAVKAKYGNYYGSEIVPGWFPIQSKVWMEPPQVANFRRAMKATGRLFLFMNMDGFMVHPEVGDQVIRTIEEIEQ